ncbi:MAG: AAA family ATPase, partial [Chloroflexota bacterium]|nr:AAA family ATPase [Chloroflexota bacterium]
TRHITHKYNELFTTLVTERYVESFEQTLRDMRRPLRVKIRTSSRKGETLKQIVVEADPSVVSKIAEPQKILSEGEKRAVALADFLTEVAMDTTSSGIILDDPVTSLDVDWKETIADRLVQEAQRRQVIVFTHDLHFLSQLKHASSEAGVSLRTHWIERGLEDERPGYVHLDNSPATEQDYRRVGRAKDFYEHAKLAAPQDRETLLKAGFGALRTTYETFVMYDLFGGVVTRFSERIRIDNLNKVVFDQELLSEVTAKVGLLSRYIEGHSHSDQFAAQKPTPQALLDEINAFLDLQQRHKTMKQLKA